MLKRWLPAIAITAFIACGQTPQQRLLAAATRGDLAQVERLLDDGVDVNFQTPLMGQSALGDAAGQGRAEMVRFLLSRGADPGIAAKENFTPLMSAAYHGNLEILTMLIRAGADVNAVETRYGYTPLADAALTGQVEAVRLLLNAGADPTVRLNNGMTARDVAVARGHPAVAQVIDQSARSPSR